MYSGNDIPGNVDRGKDVVPKKSCYMGCQKFNQGFSSYNTAFCMFSNNTRTSCLIVNCFYNQRNLKPPVIIVSNGSSKSWTNFTESLQDFLMICWSRYLFGKNKSNVTIASCKTIFSGILRFPWLQQHIEKKFLLVNLITWLFCGQVILSFFSTILFETKGRKEWMVIPWTTLVQDYSILPEPVLKHGGC